MKFSLIKLQFRNLLVDNAAAVWNPIKRSIKVSSPCFVMLMVISFAVLALGNANAADYYVDQDKGSDSASGSKSSPWKTISKANKTLSAGDTVYISGGTYSDSINPQKSGESGSQITFTSNNGAEVLVTGSGDSNPVILSKNYITIKGLNIKGSNPPKGTHFANVMIHGNNNSIVNCNIINKSDRFSDRSNGLREMGVFISGGDGNTIQGCIIKYMSFNGVKLDTANNTTIRNNEIVDNYSNSISITSSYSDYSGNLIENNVLGGSSVSDGIQFNGNYDSSDYSTDQSNKGVVIKGNTICNNAENGIDLKGTQHILIENNVICGGLGDNDGDTDDRDDRLGGVGGITAGNDTKTSDVIIRGNFIYDNDAGIQAFDNYKIFNNTILGNNKDYTGSNSSYSVNTYPVFVGIAARWGVDGIAVKNNIIGGHNSAEICLNTSAISGVIDHNIYVNDQNTLLVDYSAKNDWSEKNLEGWKSVLSNKNSISGNDQNSFSVSPGFDSSIGLTPTGEVDREVIQLNSQSSAIDKGGFLTTTASAGSGNIVYVQDAGYFSDGFGATDGDTIKIGSNDTAQIQSIDYNKNMIVIGSKLSWNKGDGVSLAYTGESPDIGAIEYSTATTTTIPSPSLRIVVTNDD